MPEHVLLLPIMHVPSSLELSDDARDEMNKYKEALRKYYRSKGKSCVFFERNFASRHMQLQVRLMRLNICVMQFISHSCNLNFVWTF